MRTSRRVLLILLILVPALVVPLGVTAAAKGKPVPPQYSWVSLGLVEGANGLATTCEPGAIKMLRTTGAYQYMAADWLAGSEWPVLQIEAAIPWTREYPEVDPPLSGPSLTGCRGVFDPDGDGTTSVASSPLLMIATDGSGRPVELAWGFDRYAVPGKKGSTRQLEGFDLRNMLLHDGSPLVCTGTNPYTCSGTFTLRRTAIDLNAPETQGSASFRFTIEFLDTDPQPDR